MWKSIDKDGNGISVDELCSFFNVKLSPGFGKDSNVEMSDDDIMKALHGALAEAGGARGRDAERSRRRRRRCTARRRRPTGGRRTRRASRR